MATADLVIMNPPFTRPLGHEGVVEGLPVSSFAGFNTSADEQRAMSTALSRIRADLVDPAGHGYAGLASNFMDLAHQKLKPGGVLALVLPLTVIAGESWSAARRVLARYYRDLTVMTIAGVGQSQRSFSADTGMGEALVVGVRREEPLDLAVGDTLYVNFRSRPTTTVEATRIARALQDIPERRSGLIFIGEEEAGCFIQATLQSGGCASLREPSIADSMLSLDRGAVRLPRTKERHRVPIKAVGELGVKGFHDMQITGKANGPFDVIVRRDAPSYPMLWGHDADRERRLVVKPDSEGRVRRGRQDRALDVWDTATRLHFNRDFRLNSQSLAACLTPEPSIGGRAWPNFSVEGDPRCEEALALWANTTLGLISFWWVAGRQQQGRAILTISGLPALPVLDVRTLDPRQLGIAARIFEDFRDWTFLPANEAYRDETRKALDRAVLCDLLGLPESILEPLDVLRAQWCAEPTVHGGKSTRPT